MIQNTLDENQFQFFSNFKRITREIDRDITIYNRKEKRIGIETRKKRNDRTQGRKREKRKEKKNLDRKNIADPIRTSRIFFFFFY